MSAKMCTWDNTVASRLVHNKKAIGAALFICFLGYTAAAILSEMKRGTRVGKNMNRYMNDVAYSQLFFFIAAICVVVLTPGVFATILIYLYMFA